MNQANLILYVVDDDEAVRKSLTYLLASRGYQVQLFDSGESFLARADVSRAGCVILDLRMDPGMSGLQVFETLHTRKSPLITLFLSAHGDISMAVEATKKGAFGWLEKPCADAKLLDSIALVLAEAATVADKLPAKREAEERWNSLTPRQRDVANIVRHGKANKEIARALNIDVRTVETHRAKVFEKVEASNPTELGRYLREHDL
jgi:FixJ family two-component response regulator